MNSWILMSSIVILSCFMLISIFKI
jgi:hypothetical protein